ncbi:GNAT family N-acetyltransferase [Salsuginibacillus kocurii]|uniref:GNAT family N-acetyltransferase n=1 Tax=Salsuginibacillus kocurii TaxID=427078 RepID=UPI0003718E71|nr:GNAT family N-acetyltransferase [Salsuginibacillus kocurii]
MQASDLSVVEAKDVLAVKIRLLTPRDAKKYIQLRLESLQKDPTAFAMTYEDEIGKENLTGQMKKKLSNPHALTFGAFKKRELVGVVTLHRESASKLRHKAHVLAMYVSPEHRKEGVGFALLSRLIEVAHTLQLEQLQLSVVATNDSAKALYETHGFEVMGIERRALKKEDEYWDEAHMVKFLT